MEENARRDAALKAGRGAAKGYAFERAVCHSLSVWISAPEKRTDIFWRSAMSGGRATRAARAGIKNLTQAGDISSVDPLGARLTDHFVIECKAYKDLETLQSFLKDVGKLYRFWVQAQEQAARIDRLPFLIARQNMMPTLCLFPSIVLPFFGLTIDHAALIAPRWMLL